MFLTKSHQRLSQSLHHGRISNPTVHEVVIRFPTEQADLTMGMSSLPEAIHVTLGSSALPMLLTYIDLVGGGNMMIQLTLLRLA